MGRLLCPGETELMNTNMYGEFGLADTIGGIMVTTAPGRRCSTWSERGVLVHSAKQVL